MVTSLNQSNPARETGYEAVQYICGRLTLNGVADAVKVKLGTIPAGAVMVAIYSRVVTAITGGTPVLGLGSVAAGGATPAVGTTGNINAVMAEAAGSEALVPSATVAQPFATDTDIWAGTSGGATAGDAVIACAYIKPLA